MLSVSHIMSFPGLLMLHHSTISAVIICAMFRRCKLTFLTLGKELSNGGFQGELIDIRFKWINPIYAL